MQIAKNLMQRPNPLRSFKKYLYLAFFPALLSVSSALCWAQPQVTAADPDAEPANLFVEEFFMDPDLRFKHDILEVNGFLFLNTPNVDWNTQYSVITDFDGEVLKSRFVPGMRTLDHLEKWIDENVEAAKFEGVEVRRLGIPPKPGQEEGPYAYWIGNRSFTTAEKAQAGISSVRSAAEEAGGNFDRMVADADMYIRPLQEEKPPVEIKPPEVQAREEAIALKWAEKLSIGEKLFGAFHGTAPGEPILWQSFGETTWRNTNLEDTGFNSQVGFWTNRLVFKGIRAPLNTINPYVESTISMESVGAEFKSNLKLFAGLEWRPLEINATLYNFRPWGLPLLEWVRNYRLYVQYGDRKNIKGEITNSDNHDLIWGVNIFYEWGIDLPALAETGRPSGFTDILRRYVWGEYFGNYRFEMTNFGSEDDFDAFIFNSSVILGLRMPGIPLPENPINPELVLMPYMRFEHVNNDNFSFPFQNQYLVAAGVRWMPFRTYRFKENEWLSKVKIFGEYVGVGLVQHAKQNGEAPNAVRYDWRVGINVSSRRF